MFCGEKMREINIRKTAEEFYGEEGSFGAFGNVLTGRDYTGFSASATKALEYMMAAMFPRHLGEAGGSAAEIDRREDLLQEARDNLIKALRYIISDNESIVETADELIGELPEIMRLIKTDLVAAYQGDPAAKSIDEIILSYPAFKAISTYRIAHRLYLMKVDILPRFFTELAHQTTGIDIHPGASIGEYFFIDHGTGVVIGETTTIGEHVKLYQHVTLGAKSFAVGEDGTLVKGIKRHPDIGNNVVIYAGATILGGETVIGDGAVIGGNTWITHSVPAGKTVTIKE